jgi:hypothetical protein
LGFGCIGRKRTGGKQSAQAIRQWSRECETNKPKLIGAAQANSVGVFEVARQLSARSHPTVDIHAKRQTVMLNEQIKELAALG